MILIVWATAIDMMELWPGSVSKLIALQSIVLDLLFLVFSYFFMEIFGRSGNPAKKNYIICFFSRTIHFRWLKSILNEFLWWFMLDSVLLIVIKSWYIISAAKLLCGHTVYRLVFAAQCWLTVWILRGKGSIP